MIFFKKKQNRWFNQVKIKKIDADTFDRAEKYE